MIQELTRLNTKVKDTIRQVALLPVSTFFQANSGCQITFKNHKEQSAPQIKYIFVIEIYNYRNKLASVRSADKDESL